MKQNLREAMLYEQLPNSRVRCHVCQWECVINPDKFGLCKVRQNKEGKLYTMNYAMVSSAAVDPIEKKPLFHFFPGSQVFSLGGWGCNFHCQDCQNWQIACVEELPAGSQIISPEAAIEATKRNDCAGIAWTYNEPAIWFEYTLDSARLARQNKLYTVYVTNGFLTTEALDTIGPFLDAWRVDIKGFSDAFYRNLARVARWRGILEVARRAKEKWRMHVEVVTNLIPTMNDDEEQLKGIASWIVAELGELTPWHVTRFYPHHLMNHLSPTPTATLERALAIGHEAGLRFVYAGNIPGHPGENTVCYSCGKIAIKRWGYQVQLLGLSGSKCQSCGADLNIRSRIVERCA